MSAIRGNSVDPLSVLQDVDNAGIHVADIHGIAGSDNDTATRRERPAFDKFPILVEDRNTLVIAVIDENPALGIQGDAVWYLKLPGL